jgi:hypothetical protein
MTTLEPAETRVVASECNPLRRLVADPQPDRVDLMKTRDGVEAEVASDRADDGR